MAWARLDDSIYTHPKFLTLEPAAVGLYAMGLAYCTHHLSDGYIPQAQVPRLICAAPAVALKLASLLVHGGLWEKDLDGFRVHDYLDWNPSAADIRLDRAQRRARNDRYRARQRSASGDASQDALDDASLDASHNTIRDASRDASQDGLYATPRHTTSRKTERTPPYPPLSHHHEADELHLPVEASTWVHPDGCPRTAYLDRFPVDRQRQCPQHRGERGSG
jgi:hypothetical protein